MKHPDGVYAHMIGLLERSGAAFKVFHHRPVLTYDDAALARQELGFTGTEGKCLVLKADDGFAVYTTTQGQRTDFRRVRRHLGARRVRLATDGELREHFGAQPGNAYPFGFDAEVRILVDPAIYEERWMLFSPCIPTATIQMAGADLRRVFASLPN